MRDAVLREGGAEEGLATPAIQLAKRVKVTRAVTQHGPESVGVLKPEMLWDADKVRLGREWLGETGMMLFFGGFALLGPAADGTAPLPPAPRSKVPLPNSFRVEELAGCLRISWKEPLGGPLVGLVFWLGLGLAPAFHGLPMYLAAYALVALGLAYVLLAKLVNLSSVEASGGRLRIAHGPLPVPWRCTRTLLAVEIDQLACSSFKWRNSTSFSLCSLSWGDEDYTTLVFGLAEPQQALYLEQQFERRLGIADRPVKGELIRSTAGPGDAGS